MIVTSGQGISPRLLLPNSHHLVGRQRALPLPSPAGGIKSSGIRSALSAHDPLRLTVPAGRESGSQRGVDRVSVCLLYSV